MSFSVAHAAVPADWWVDIVNDRVQNVQAMLQRGTDPNAISPKGQPSIMLAVRNNAWRVFDLLAADPQIKLNITNRNDETPLMYLAVVGQTKRALALIKRGADVNRLGWTPLHYAASTGKVDTARMLIANGAIVNAPSPNGTTPLMMAAFSGSRAMTQLLLDAGADATTRNLDGKSSADWASGKGFTDLAVQLDTAAKKVMAQRQAQREKDLANRAQTLPVSDGTNGNIMNATAHRNSAAHAENQAGNGTMPMGADSAPASHAVEKAGGQGSTAPANASTGQAASATNGTSRYFDKDDTDLSAGH